MPKENKLEKGRYGSDEDGCTAHRETRSRRWEWGSNFAGRFKAAYSLPLPEVKEYVLYFLLRKWDRALIPPGGVGLSAGVVLRCLKVTQFLRRRAPTVERLS